MSRVRNSDTALEKLLCEELNRHGVTTFTRNNKTIFGKPDIAFIARKIAVFCEETSGMVMIGKMRKTR